MKTTLSIAALAVMSANAQLITSSLPSCKSPTVDDDIAIHPMCDGSVQASLAGLNSPDCNLFKYWWKLSLRATESCMIDKTNFGNSFMYNSHCNQQNL